MKQNIDKRIAEIRKRLKLSTPGPWTIEPYNSWDKDIIIIEPGITIDHDDVDHQEAEANANFILHSKKDMLWLLNMLEDLLY